MAKTTAPLLSFGAGGAIAKTQVYSKWRGVPYARRYVIPANPRTAEQTLTRSAFAQLREMWKVSPELQQAPWNAFATGRPFLGFNKYIGENIRVMRGEPDMSNFIGSPGARGGLPAIDMAVVPTATAGELQVTFGLPTAPTGWTLNSIVAVGFEQQAPDDFFTGPYVADSEPGPADTLTLTGLDSGAVAVVSGWLIWNKPDGTLAYSVSQTTTATPL
jgi:hypothetical protein